MKFDVILQNRKLMENDNGVYKANFTKTALKYLDLYSWGLNLK